MLQKLYIQNYAIIDEIGIDFSANLNIITGETGAGKSILVGALSLILGERADSNTLMNKEKKCVVEGFFKTKNKSEVRHFLKEQDLDLEEELVVRREIGINGKSRAFINDTPVNLQQLKALSSLLVDLHQQFDTLELNDQDFQREVLDALAGNGDLLREYTAVYLEYIKTKKELAALQQLQQNANTTLDYNQYLFNELEEADFKENELEELDIELRLLNNAENIKQQLGSIYFELKESDLPIVQQLKSLSNKLHYLEEYNNDIKDLNKRLLGAQAELQDIAEELEKINDSVQYNAEKVQAINDRISLGYKLLKKHSVNTTGELLGMKESLGKKLGEILNITGAIEEKDRLLHRLLKGCEDLAGSISANRNKILPSFMENVNNLLIQVGMPNARVKVLVQTMGLNNYGSDDIQFLFDANNNNRFESLGNVASGGELSRLMLCIKSLVAQKLQLPTLIFDEIDTGISGEAARQVGLIMKTLSKSHQLISITHQPQIAAKATAHYFVYKSIKGNKITTSIRLLNNDERVTTIAQMLSGEKPTAAALENAREMVRN